MKKQDFEQTIIGVPGERRRRQFISIVAWTIVAGCLFVFATILYYREGESVQELLAYSEVRRLSTMMVTGGLASSVVLILLRNTRLVAPAGVLITIISFLLVVSADDLTEIANGRSAIFLVGPVLIAAITVHPYAAFISAEVITLFFLLHPEIHVFNVYAFGGVWVMAFYIWLATSVMEKAITTAQQETYRVRAMLGIVSHELRTPLGSISGYLDLILIGKGQSDLQFEMLSRMKASTQALVEMVNRLLDSAHIQSGRLDLKPVPTPTRNIFDPLTQTIERRAHEKGLQFEYGIRDMPGVIVIDPIRLQQIIMNLLDNALKYTESGKVSLEVCGAGNKLKVTVGDTGKGIAARNIPLIFQEFQQVQHYATRDHGGVGLGLFIVRSLVDLMDGSITVESKPDRGSTFIVVLPLQLVN
jgi:signal transduction histidine kinase